MLTVVYEQQTLGFSEHYNLLTSKLHIQWATRQRRHKRSANDTLDTAAEDWEISAY